MTSEVIIRISQVFMAFSVIWDVGQGCDIFLCSIERRAAGWSSRTLGLAVVMLYSWMLAGLPSPRQYSLGYSSQQLRVFMIGITHLSNTYMPQKATLRASISCSEMIPLAA